MHFQHSTAEATFSPYHVYSETDTIWSQANYFHATKVIVHRSPKTGRYAVKFIF